MDAYLRHITIERGLSDHTVAAYRRDLAGYIEWLTAQGVDDTAAVTPAMVTAFAAERASAEPPAAASSLARLQSSVRGLHRFLVREGDRHRRSLGAAETAEGGPAPAEGADDRPGRGAPRRTRR